MASKWAWRRKMPGWLDLAATVQARSVWRKDWICFTWSTLQGSREEVCVEQSVACRASDSRSVCYGSTVEWGRFALFSRLTQQASVFSPEASTLHWFVFGWKSDGKDCKTSLIRLLYIEAELPDQLRRPSQVIPALWTGTVWSMFQRLQSLERAILL